MWSGISGGSNKAKARGRQPNGNGEHLHLECLVISELHYPLNSLPFHFTFFSFLNNSILSFLSLLYMSPNSTRTPLYFLFLYFSFHKYFTFSSLQHTNFSLLPHFNSKKKKNMIQFFDYQLLLKATNYFSPSTLIGKGSHGSVYKATLHDNTILAVKKPLQLQTHLIDNSKLDNEARVLSSLPHNSLLINFLGTSLESSTNNKLLVMEYMPNGSLHDLLLSPSTSSSSSLLTWPKRLQIITQIARAVQFLHQGKPLVIHRDIKAENILFDSNWNLKLADFGLAVSQHDGCLSPPAGTIGYLDPCYTTPTKLSTKTDVFSFGVLVLEIMSGRKAMDVSKSPASIIEWAIPLIEEKRFQQIFDTRMEALPKYMEGTARKMLKVAARCVSPNQGKRPSMMEIVKVVETQTSCCFIERERVKCPVWSSLVKNVVSMRKRRRRMGKEWKMMIECWKAQTGDDPRGMLLLREVLGG